MKKTQVIGVIFIAVCLGVLVNVLSDPGKMAGFEQAFADPAHTYRVSGFLDKEQEVIYDPITNASMTTFHMKDQDGLSRKIILDKSKPQGFEMSESLVITGRADGEICRAEELLMKCPSKYNEENHMIQEAGTGGI